MARAQAGFLDQRVDPHTATRRQQKSGRKIDTVRGAAAFRQVSDPTLGRGNARDKVRRRTHGVTEPHGAFAENVARRYAFVNERRHVDSDQSVERRGLEQDVEDVNVAGHVDLGST